MSEKIPFYFIPSHGGATNNPSYDPLFEVLSEHYDPRLVSVAWQNDNHQEWLGDIADVLEPVAQEGKPYAIGAHSQGCLLGAEWINSVEKVNQLTRGRKPFRPPLGFMAASLSPFAGPARDSFLRDVMDNPDSNFHGFSLNLRRSLLDVNLPRIATFTQLYVGSEEKSYMHVAAGAALATFENAEYWMAEGSGHNIRSKEYLKCIGEHVGQLATGKVSPIPDWTIGAPRRSECNYSTTFSPRSDYWRLLRSGLAAREARNRERNGQ